MEEIFKTYRIVDGLSARIKVLKKDFLSLCDRNAETRMVNFMRCLAIGSIVILQRKIKLPARKRAKWLEVCKGRVTIRHERFAAQIVPSLN